MENMMKKNHNLERLQTQLVNSVRHRKIFNLGNFMIFLQEIEITFHQKLLLLQLSK